MINNAYVAKIADMTAAGINNKSAGRHKFLYLLMISAGNQAIDYNNPLVYHLYSCLHALVGITGHQDYMAVKVFRDIAMLVLRDWDVVADSTYTYRIAADVYRMMRH